MKLLRTCSLAVALAGTAAPATAHVTVQSGPAISGAANLVTFQIAHGCTNVNGVNDTVMHDTLSLTLHIPLDAAGNPLVTAVRPVSSTGFAGNPTLTTDASGNVTSLTWAKPEASLTATDVLFYLVQVRFTLKGGAPLASTAAFSQLTFTADQVCEDPATHAKKTVFWDGVDHGGGAEPGPALTVVASRMPGWNQYTISTHILDPSVFFADAQIVWRDTAAYSANPATAAAITMAPGVTSITAGIHPDDVIWVKY